MHRQMSLIAIVLVLLAAAVGLSAEGMTFPRPQGPAGSMRTLSFPEEGWVGNLSLEPESGPGWDDEGVRFQRPWDYFAASRGEVKVPADRNVRLIVILALTRREASRLRQQNPGAYQMLTADRVREDPSDLSGLRELDPNDLCFLSVHSGTYRRMGADPEVFRPLRRLTGLQMLSLQSTGITSEGLEHLRSLQSLRGLELTQFGLGTKGLAVLRDLPALEYLNLNADVTDAGLEQIAEISGLRWLNITGGKVWGPGLAELARLPRLEQFCLWGNVSISDRHMKYLAEARQLRAITLWGPDETLTDAGLNSIAKIDRLEELVIFGGPPGVTPVGVGRLRQLKHLKKIIFGHAWIGLRGQRYGDEVARQLATMPQLESIEGVAYLSAEGTKALATLPNLKVLDVSLKDRRQGYVGPTGLSHLADLSRLEKLSIATGDQLPDADLATLESLHNLKALSLGFLGVSDRGLASIGKLTQLEHLHVTTLTRSGLNQLNGLSNLRSLNVTGAWGDAARIAEADEGRLDLSGLTKLEDFYLAGLPLQEEDMAFLQHLKAAKIVMIQPTARISGTYLRHLAGLPELELLRALNLSGCMSEDIASLNTVPKLRSLRLQGDVTDGALIGLTGPELLESVRIETDNPISPVTVNELIESHPVLEYVHVTTEMPEQMRPAASRQRGRRRK